MMKRPSNVVLAFTTTLAASLLIWVGWLIYLKVTQPSTPEEKIDYESQLNQTSNKIILKSSLKLPAP